jgi:hypothetical protein
MSPSTTRSRRHLFCRVLHAAQALDFEGGRPIVASELRSTLTKFAAIYRGQTSRGQADKLQFAFVANRRLGDKVRASLEELVDGTEAFTHPTEAASLRG